MVKESRGIFSMINIHQQANSRIPFRTHDFNMKLPASLSFWKEEPVNIVINLHSQNHTDDSFYSTADHIEGWASVFAKSDTEIQGIHISLQGVTRNDVELISSLRQKYAKHIFLSMHQPKDEMRIPISKVLRAGERYEFPFQFVVPEYLLPKICGHCKSNANVSHAHLRLPPSMSSSTHKLYPTSNDGLSPDVVDISYSIRVSVSAPPREERPCQPLCSVFRPIWIIPMASECPPMSHLNHRLYRLHNSCTVKSTLWNFDDGRLLVSAQQPKPVPISTMEMTKAQYAGSIVAMELEFISETSQEPPKLSSVTASLMAVTFYSSKAWEDFPDLSFGTADFGTEGKGLYQKRIPLSEKCLKLVKLNNMEPMNTDLLFPSETTLNRSMKFINRCSMISDTSFEKDGLASETHCHSPTIEPEILPTNGRLISGVQFRPVVAVIGVGYVGSHLVEAFAKSYKFIAFDISKNQIEQAGMQLKGLSVHFTTNASDLAIADAFLISVPTNLNDDKKINTTAIQKAVGTVRDHGKNGVIVVMESSVSVGMTRAFLGPLVSTKKFRVGMSPERVDPGRKHPVFQAIPKIISGIGSSSLDAIRELYEPVFDQLVIVSSLEVAEMTKLYENCQRMVCAAYSNEMANACATMGIDGWEVSQAAASKPFGYLPFQPGPGVGGHCIPVNPYYLLQTCDMPILRQATESSARRPLKMVDCLMRVLQCERDTKLAQREILDRYPRVLVVGVAFKKGQDALCNSPGVIASLNFLAQHVDVKFADPLVSQEALPDVPRLETPKNWTRESLESFDGILVVIDQVGLDMNILDALDGVIIHDYSPRSH
ncbi:hypothetical protein PENSTE_c005G06292 [Penicillium steckii]|uniref:UDP-glucose/GDP-mannose dehydrogenase C-terminal domain-containing protein n=1 Tax=Penicillium steckii TaxID=303698 RepID=A0A1V6TJM9_9EURO|nr:hypothetical protein PENSTE_c005G06292 [Penicillium steckii]